MGIYGFGAPPQTQLWFILVVGVIHIGLLVTIFRKASGEYSISYACQIATGGAWVTAASICALAFASHYFVQGEPVQALWAISAVSVALLCASLAGSWIVRLKKTSRCQCSSKRD